VSAVITAPSPSPAGAGTVPAVDKRLKALRRFALSITAFTVAGHLVLGFEQAPVTPLVTMLGAYTVAFLLEALDSWARGKRPEFAGGGRAAFNFLLPVHIAAMATAMLLYGNESLWPYLFAVTVAVSSKYVVRIRVHGRPRHILNPSNTGIAVTLLLFPWVGIAPPYQFTSAVTGAWNWFIPLGVLVAGTLLNLRLTGRTPLIAAWVGGFVVQAVLRWLILDHSLLGALMPMTGLAFILFTNYMITDPATTPVRPRHQVVFGLTAAAAYGVLVTSHVVFGLFFALVVTCLLRGGVHLLAPAATALAAAVRGRAGGGGGEVPAR
jgi:enediyne biosynthesis protein E5